jgi:Tol biopolymer transport system component
VFPDLTPGAYDGEQTFFFNIGVATLNGATITQLTHNEQNQTYFVVDMYPQLSPDGQSIIDTHIGPDPATGMRVWGIGKMNLDGTNFQPIFQKLGVDTWMPTYSPDGKMIAVEMAQRLGDGDYLGIATMNADGSNVMQLTGLLDTSNYSCWDEMPAFTSDGKKIVFARECWLDSGGVNSQLYSMNPDGTGITAIHGSTQGGFISCQPRMFANGSVVFSSNVDAPRH